MKTVKKLKPIEKRCSIFDEPKVLRLQAIELLKKIKEKENLKK